MSDGFYRCTHCAGFYGVEAGACVYCGYEAPLLERNGEPKVFAGRETCRAIQVAQWRALPAEVREDPMGPPEGDLEALCGCLHCGEFGPRFEAVEMRWLDKEGMWACPCTICGGRGFEFDIFPVESRWECAHCGHRWAPPDGNYKSSNCHCPMCGSTEASGRYEDEYSQEEIDEMTEDQYKAAFGMSRAEEAAECQAFNETWEQEHPEEAAREKREVAERQAAWEREQRQMEEAEAQRDQGIGYDPEAGFAEERAEEAAIAEGFGLSYPVSRLPDDIDFPRVKDGAPWRKQSPEGDDAQGPEGALGDDDIPY